MTATCSLDEFIQHNTKEVRVDPYSPPIEFPALDYRVPPGALFDLRVLRGEGYTLFAAFTVEGVDISKDVGTADILDRFGEHTGYNLVQHGSNHSDGSHCFSAYFIGSRSRLPVDEQLARYTRVTEKYKDVLWGPADKE